MKCEDAIKNMDRFVNHNLTTKELAEFLEHIDSCPSCYEELETYYTVAIALHYLDQNDGEGYNIPHRLQHNLQEARNRVRREKRYYVALHILLIILVTVLILMLIFVQAPEIGGELEDFLAHFLRIF